MGLSLFFGNVFGEFWPILLPFVVLGAVVFLAELAIRLWEK